MKTADAAVKEREDAVTGAEKTKAANTIADGTWTVGQGHRERAPTGRPPTSALPVTGAFMRPAVMAATSSTTIFPAAAGLLLRCPPARTSSPAAAGKKQ